MSICVNVYVCECMCACMYTCVCMSIYIHVCVCVCPLCDPVWGLSSCCCVNGFGKRSFGYNGSDGYICLEGKRRNFGTLFGPGDVVGLGYKRDTLELFCTRNGSFLGESALFSKLLAIRKAFGAWNALCVRDCVYLHTTLRQGRRTWEYPSCVLFPASPCLVVTSN